MNRLRFILFDIKIGGGALEQGRFGVYLGPNDS